MDIRFSIAFEVAEEMGARVLVNELCNFTRNGRDCGWPLLEKPEQGMPFCWGCTTDRINAQRGRTALTKARMAEKGIIIEDLHAAPAIEPEHHDNWSFTNGMAL
jgi:hypothetical protein